MERDVTPQEAGPLETFVRRGYPKSWFNWIEALTLTVALAVVLTKAQGELEQIVIGGMALLSFVFAYFIAIVGLADFAATYLGDVRLPKPIAWVLALVVTLAMMVLIVFAITAVILRSI